MVHPIRFYRGANGNSKWHDDQSNADMPMNIVLRILENIQDIVLACPAVNMSTFETLGQLYLICRHVMLVSFCTQIYKVRPKTDSQCKKDKRRETGTSVFKYYLF